MITLFSYLKKLESQLVAVTDEAALEAKILLCEAMQIETSVLLRDLSCELDSEVMAQVDGWMQQRLSGVPLAYVLGTAMFRGHVYIVRPGVLIPRPETELLVEKAIEITQETPMTILECGVGSGIIGIELALACPDCRVLGWDISGTAILVAQENANRLGVSIDFRHADFFSEEDVWGAVLALGEPVLLVSNPPYISESEFVGLDRGVREFEPREALVGDENGLGYYRRLLTLTKPYPKVRMVFEIGSTQQEDLTQILAELGYDQYQFFLDYAGLSRVLVVNVRSQKS